jgi:hypothetical protein
MKIVLLVLAKIDSFGPLGRQEHAGFSVLCLLLVCFHIFNGNKRLSSFNLRDNVGMVCCIRSSLGLVNNRDSADSASEVNWKGGALKAHILATWSDMSIIIFV